MTAPSVGLSGVSRCLASLFGWVLPLVALLVQVLYGLGGRSHSVVTALGFLGCYLVSVVLHELGHCFAGKFLGLNPVLVSIGHGDLLREIFAGGITWRFHALPFSGYVYPFPINRSASRSRTILMLAAGPLLNALVAGCCLLLIVDLDSASLHPAGRIELEALVLNLFLVNAFVCLRSLIPLFNTSNDGQEIWKLLWSIKRVSPSETCTEARKEMEATSLAWKEALRVWPLSHLLAIYRHRIHSANTTSKERLGDLDAFACVVLLSGASAYLPEADEYSRKLAEAKPNDSSVLATRGSILIELGQLDDGMKILQRIYEHEQRPFNRGLAAAFMALGYARRDDVDSARHWVGLGREADPECIPLNRIEGLLSSRSPVV